MALIDSGGIVWPNAVTDVSTTTNEASWTPWLGIIRWAYDTTNNCMCAYRCVKYRTAVTIAGQSFVHTYSTASRKNYDVLQAVTATLNLLAGVSMATASAGIMGWLQIYGYNATILMLENAGLTANAGRSLKAVDQENYLAIDQAVGTEATYRHNYVTQYGLCTGAVSKAAAGFIHCLS